VNYHRLLVCGGRDFTRRVLLFKTLDDLHAQHQFRDFIQGGARGADALAKLWAKTHPEIVRWECRANWTAYGNAAGPIRNTKMLTWLPDLVVAFPTGGPGTADMMTKARSAGVPVIEIR
jgi:hypothetical protein